MKEFKTTFYFETEKDKRIFDEAVENPKTNKLVILGVEEGEEPEKNEEK